MPGPVIVGSLVGFILSGSLTASDAFPIDQPAPHLVYCSENSFVALS
jgi:hypothetical protein